MCRMKKLDRLSLHTKKKVVKFSVGTFEIINRIQYTYRHINIFILTLCIPIFNEYSQKHLMTLFEFRNVRYLNGTLSLTIKRLCALYMGIALWENSSKIIIQ